MYKVFYTLEELYQHIHEDKNWEGAEAAMLNRYPIRFILFENFSDFNKFVQNPPQNVYVQSVDKWIDSENFDVMITYSQLVERITEYIKCLPVNDFVIAPFSEVARFYDNKRYFEFDSLVKTIRLIQPSENSQLNHQRLYIPIIGMQGKMGKFAADINTHVWEYKSGDKMPNYKLILTRDTTYNVEGLEESYSIVRSLLDWLKLWEHGEDVKQNIICSSKAIFDNAVNAQPDNAFTYIICNNAYEFLTNGLKLNLSMIEPKEEELKYWEELARIIDVTNFDFDNFINQQFGTYGVSGSNDFVKNWLDCTNSFERWLLITYYLKKYGDSTYLGRVILGCKELSTSELFSNLATRIFDEVDNEQSIQERRDAMKEAMLHGVKITEYAECKIREKLIAIVKDPEQGYCIGTKMLTSLTEVEKSLMVEWLGKDKIDRKDIKDIFPELYYYTYSQPLQIESANHWVNDYFECYRSSKIANVISEEVKDIISEKNGTTVNFQAWYDSFKTVKTLLHNRKDIEVFYWIDGLGVDWVPFVSHVINKHNFEGVYLNEIYIGVSELPTCTANNKLRLQELSNGELKKIGDLDAFAHKNKSYPNYIIEEMHIVEKAISDILSQYNGKKIAIVSDHGVTYLSQFSKGLNLAGIQSDHSGRVVTHTSENIVADHKYIVLDDKKTMCALDHDSLAAKVSKGQGAHGGCTPEEVLVPVIIVSGNKNASSFTATLLDNEISAASPVVLFKIKGLSTVDNPIISYNEVNYHLNKVNEDVYESERLNLVDTSTRIVLHIGNFKQIEILKINTGVEEDDQFKL